MKPPFEITHVILNLVSAISEQIGEINAAHLHRPSPELRKKNRIKTIKASLEIEGNTLSEEQMTALLEHNKVIGPKKDIQEVTNAIYVYEKLPEFDPASITSFLKAHKLLMKGLIDSPGKLRSKSVGVFKGKEVAHIGAPADRLNFLMNDLFQYLENGDVHALIKSCVVHYEIEFIHPFMDGNGRMGRLWQTLILLKAFPIFEFLPFETIIKERQKQYYRVLAECDASGKSNQFIEFILSAINESLGHLLKNQNRIFTSEERVEYFLFTYGEISFSRKEYMNVFKDISSSTASRDLKYAVDQNLIHKEGDKRLTQYKINKPGS